MPLVPEPVVPEASKASIAPCPAGRITLLFTDIENSTRMTEALGDAVYRKDLRDPHCQRIRAAVAEHAGTEVKTIGDSFMLVFPSSDRGLACAAAIQKRLTETPLTATDRTGKAWEVRVRIGVHTAERELQPHPEGDRWDYTGTDVNFAARVESLGAGGQIIVSDSAYRAGARELYQWQEWPSRRIKSFSEPETVWELMWDGRSRGEPGSRWLPDWFLGEANRYIARPVVEGKVLALLAGPGSDGRTPRLVTIHGFGGMGKTRLAIACAIQAVGLFDGVFFVGLEHQLALKNSVAEAIGATFGWNGDAALPERILQALRERKCLLVLDNFETVDCNEVREFVYVLVAETRNLRLLVTGREAVKLDATEYLIDLDDPSNNMTPEECRALFVERARQKLGQGWNPNERDEAAIRRIVELTDRIPLAIELAAAWTKHHSLEEIAAGIAATPLCAMSAEPPRHGRAIGADRHSSLRRCLEWSYQLLEPEAQDAFSRLGIFAASFTAQTAAEVCDLPAAQARLYRLQDASLVQRFEVAGTSRYQMNRFTVSYAGEKLAKLPAADTIRQRFLAHFRALAIAPHDLNDPAVVAALKAELDNTFPVGADTRFKDWSQIFSLSRCFVDLMMLIGVCLTKAEHERAIVNAICSAEVSLDEAQVSRHVRRELEEVCTTLTQEIRNRVREGKTLEGLHMCLNRASWESEALFRERLARASQSDLQRARRVLFLAHQYKWLESLGAPDPARFHLEVLQGLETTDDEPSKTMARQLIGNLEFEQQS